MDLDKCRVIEILGDIHSGKTNLGVHLLRDYKGNRKIYALGYPTKIDNFISLSSKLQLNLIENGIIFIDELPRFFRMYEKNSSREFIELVSLFAHKNNTLIFTAQLSQNITKAMEAFVDGFCVTRIQDLTTLKVGSRAKKVVEDCADIRKTSWGLYLEQGEYLCNCVSHQAGEGGVLKFPFQNVGKDWTKNHNTAVAHGVAQEVTHEVAHELAHELAHTVTHNLAHEDAHRLAKKLPTDLRKQAIIPKDAQNIQDIRNTEIKLEKIEDINDILNKLEEEE